MIGNIVFFFFGVVFGFIACAVIAAGSQYDGERVIQGEYGTYYCPVCTSCVNLEDYWDDYTKIKYCPECGCKLDWSDINGR